jgi:hypothetical protein
MHVEEPTMPDIPQQKRARQYFRLSPQQQARLKAIAARHDSSVSALVRLAIKRLLEAEDAGKLTS